MLTNQQRVELSELGFVVLRRAFDRHSALTAADAIWDYLEQHRGVQRNDPSTWQIEGPWLGLKTLRETPAFQALQSNMVEEAVSELLGDDNWTRLPHWGGFLVSFPDRCPSDWTLPTSGWHVDYQFTHDVGAWFGIQAFVYLTDVQPKGGGTLVIPGSHRLTERFVKTLNSTDLQQKYGQLRDRFHTTDPWLRELISGEPMAGDRAAFFMRDGYQIDGIPVKVAELCAEPGDAILVHPWLVHMVSQNAGPGPRFVLHRNVHAN